MPFVQKITIRIVIAERVYRLTIHPSEEERVRKAAKYIKEKMELLKSQYSDKDGQDYLAMVSLLLCADLLEKEEQLLATQQQAERKLAEVNSVLADFLQREG